MIFYLKSSTCVNIVNRGEWSYFSLSMASNAWVIFVFLAMLSGAKGQNYDRCASNQFACADYRYCIYKNQWCDGVRQCPGGYDEQYCNRRGNSTHAIICPNELMACEREGCVPSKARCDGMYTCRDGSDERNCDRDTSRVHVTPPPATLDIPDVEDFDNDYDDDDTNYSKEERNAMEWVLKQRKDYAWGEDTERAIVALSLSKGNMGSDSEKEEMLMIKTLHLRISLALRNWKETSLSRRAHFINGLIATCGNFKDFYGYNLVDDLAGMVDDKQRNRVFVAPIVYLTLCLTNASTLNYIQIMKREANRLTDNSKNDLKALYLLTTVCLEKRETDGKNSQILERIKRYLVKKLVTSDAENIYELALVTQALNAARVNPATWDRELKMKSILNHQDKEGSFTDMLATYYVMPLLSGKSSLLSIGDHCDLLTKRDSVSMESPRNSNKRMSVKYTLNFGPQNVSQTILLSVLNNCTVYDVMTLAAKRNSNFRFSLDDKKNSAPLVYSIGGVPNDAERGLFWILEVSVGNHDYVVQNIKTYSLQPGYGMVFSIKDIQY